MTNQATESLKADRFGPDRAPGSALVEFPFLLGLTQTGDEAVEPT
jgi:hypothetical protein